MLQECKEITALIMTQLSFQKNDMSKFIIAAN
jgi:hypothetical protein